ncbi:uncharacterized protein SCHCODRAFT_02608297 [Schizophyllum commune H4-8]|uniref:uncharacterized protein n=1 Tax=Schizophyllum commune (strain H4-8 / FGSC 9210) TaxID=578458 RepID=UPI00215DFF03|nr:uncharacterized protein SCHCODRAFT_02608297 [Schizophyllum commune H4-8]KAI5900588.1 hypothetical protein SCHCODRAFT_02608297 [Schizophyllum commune H4-8]
MLLVPQIHESMRCKSGYRQLLLLSESHERDRRPRSQGRHPRDREITPREQDEEYEQRRVSRPTLSYQRHTRPPTTSVIVHLPRKRRLKQEMDSMAVNPAYVLVSCTRKLWTY